MLEKTGETTKTNLFEKMPTVKSFVGSKDVFEIHNSKVSQFVASKDSKDYKLVAMYQGKSYYVKTSK